MINTRLFWIKKLQLQSMNNYISFSRRMGTYLEDYKDFKEIEQEVYDILLTIREFRGEVTLKLKECIDIKNLIYKYTPEEIVDLVKLETREMEIIYITYRGRSNQKHIYVYFASLILENVNLEGELTEDEIKILLIKLLLAGIDLNSITNIEGIYEENEY